MSDNKRLTGTSPDHIEHSEKGAVRGSAAVSNETPSANYTRPTSMNLAGPPSDGEGSISSAEA